MFSLSALTQSHLTFQILTQEDWNIVLFNGMPAFLSVSILNLGMAQTPWAALYFVALMTFGNYVLFNLLVAILVEGFQESKEEEKRKLVSLSYCPGKLQLFEEEEARRHAEFEQSKQQQEIKDLLLTTTSKPYMESKKAVTQCTCATENLTSLRYRLEHRQRARSSASDAVILIARYLFDIIRMV